MQRSVEVQRTSYMTCMYRKGKIDTIRVVDAMLVVGKSVRATNGELRLPRSLWHSSSRAGGEPGDAPQLKSLGREVAAAQMPPVVAYLLPGRPLVSSTVVAGVTRSIARKLLVICGCI